MFTNEYSSFQYTDRWLVLKCLRQIIKKELTGKERSLLYLYCGVGVDAPMGWCELTSRLKLLSPEITEKYYYRVVEKVREAIPGSELDELVIGYIRTETHDNDGCLVYIH